jgi:ABC-type bacteriocin/lantibiotic exporter with double-glycine peptidase domain
LKNILQHTWQVLEKKERSRFSLLIVADIIISIIDILSLALLLWIIHFYVQPTTSLDLSFLPESFKDKHSIWMIASFLIFFSIKNLIAYLLARAYYNFSGQVAIRITEQNLSNYQQASYEGFTHVDSSVHIRKISFQPFEFSQYILAGIQQIITQVCLITVAAVAILLFNPTLFLLLFCLLLPPVIIVFFISRKRVKKIKNHIRTSNEQSFRFLLDALKGYVESNVYDRNQFFLHRYITQRKIFSKYLFESVSIQNMPSRFIEIFAVLGLFFLFAIAQWTGHTDGNTLVTIGAFMAAAYKIIPGIVKIINVSGQMKAYEYSISELTKTQSEHLPVYTSKDRKIHDLIFEEISFKYKDTFILKDLSFELQPGDFAGITGESGIGKTTLLNLLLGFLSPVSGIISINKQLANQEQIRSFWPSIAYVQQQIFLIHDSLLKNITLEEEHDTKRLSFAIAASGLQYLIDQYPEGVNTIITENGKNISGGQQQRIALARAFYKDADLILLDEPFNELDNASVTLLLLHLKNLADQGKIVIMITHDKQSFNYCNKMISLNRHG